MHSRSQLHRYVERNQLVFELIQCERDLPLDDSLRPLDCRNLCKYFGTMEKSSGNGSLTAAAASSVEPGTSVTFMAKQKRHVKSNLNKTPH